MLIVPKIAVSEVLGMESVSIETGGPAWLLGHGDWHGKRLPVVSFEVMAGQAMPGRTRRTRAVVVNAFSEHLADGAFILLAQGYPHLTALNAAALVAQPARDEDEGLALSRVRLASTQGIIPDMDAIELRIAGGLRQVPGADVALNEDWQPGPE